METTDYCNYDLSLALKKCGFDEPCDYYYNGHGNLNRYADTDRINRNTNGHHTPSCSAPTLWQAHKWLRKKHGLHTLVDFDLYGKCYYKLFPIGRCCVDEGNSGYITYEAALSGGISAVLELIKKGE